MSTQSIFGYGSLVNAATHDYGTLQVAELRGWRRQWHYTTLRDLAYLSVGPDQNATIKGTVMDVPIQNPALDSRESAYHRHVVGHQITQKGQHREDTTVFAIPASVHTAPGPTSTLLLSYLDVVVQGYFKVFGETGVLEFFETTKGWGAPVLDDRAEPIYPRHQTLSREERDLCDQCLGDLSAVVKQL